MSALHVDLQEFIICCGIHSKIYMKNMYKLSLFSFKPIKHIHKYSWSSIKVKLLIYIEVNIDSLRLNFSI